MKWYNFFWNFCWNRYLAVHQHFHWFLQPNFIPFMLSSRSRKFREVGVGNFGKVGVGYFTSDSATLATTTLCGLRVWDPCLTRTSALKSKLGFIRTAASDERRIPSRRQSDRRAAKSSRREGKTPEADSRLGAGARSDQAQARPIRVPSTGWFDAFAKFKPCVAATALQLFGVRLPDTPGYVILHAWARSCSTLRWKCRWSIRLSAACTKCCAMLCSRFPLGIDRIFSSLRYSVN